MSYEREKQTAVEAVINAAKLCQAVQMELIQVDSLEKKDKSPVTIADFGVQALVCHHLTNTFPHDPIVGEEDATALRRTENASKMMQVAKYVQRFQADATSEMICRWIDAGNGHVAERYWTLDPIDGTKGFLRNDQYAIALALIEQGEVKVAALACPALPMDLDDTNRERGVLFVAARGEGAMMTTLNGSAFVPIHVTNNADGDKFRFVESVEAAHGNSTLQETVAQRVGITRPPLRLDSQVKYGAVARGDAALYLRLPSPRTPNYREKIWDHAAGSLIVEEAGGRVTDMHGKPLDFASDYKMHHNRGVVASNGALHNAVIDALSLNANS